MPASSREPFHGVARRFLKRIQSLLCPSTLAASHASLKREWRAEWEKERAEQTAREQAPDEIADRLDQRVAGLHTQWVQAMNPETLRYYLAFRLAPS